MIGSGPLVAEDASVVSYVERLVADTIVALDRHRPHERFTDRFELESRLNVTADSFTYWQAAGVDSNGNSSLMPVTTPLISVMSNIHWPLWQIVDYIEHHATNLPLEGAIDVLRGHTRRVDEVVLIQHPRGIAARQLRGFEHVFTLEDWDNTLVVLPRPRCRALVKHNPTNPYWRGLDLMLTLETRVGGLMVPDHSLVLT